MIADLLSSCIFYPGFILSIHFIIIIIITIMFLFQLSCLCGRKQMLNLNLESPETDFAIQGAWIQALWKMEAGHTEKDTKVGCITNWPLIKAVMQKHVSEQFFCGEKGIVSFHEFLEYACLDYNYNGFLWLFTPWQETHTCSWHKGRKWVFR